MQPKPFLSLFLGLTLGGLLCDFGSAEQAGLPYHPILRDYARQRCMEIWSQTGADGTQYLRINPSFLDQHVDDFAQFFLDRLVRKLDRLKDHFKTVQQARTEALAETSGPDEKDQARHRWRKSLAAVAKSAEDLRQFLAFVLNGKAPFEPQIDEKARDSGFEDEMEFMQSQISKADQRIREYFFTPTHVIRVEDLQSGNMMAHLQRVKKMARELRKLELISPIESRADLHTGKLEGGQPRRAGQQESL